MIIHYLTKVETKRHGRQVHVVRERSNAPTSQMKMANSDSTMIQMQRMEWPEAQLHNDTNTLPSLTGLVGVVYIGVVMRCKLGALKNKKESTRKDGTTGITKPPWAELSDQKAVRHSECTRHCARQESKRIPRRIVLRGRRPELSTDVRHVSLQAERQEERQPT